jgi:hypothetical protein
MYVAVQHLVTDRKKFWEAAQKIAPPANLKLHQVFPTKDGSHGICVWEADSLPALRTWLDGETAGLASNEYFEVENKESIAMPSGV